MMQYELKVDTGAINVPIIDEKDGEVIGTFKFNPNDLDVVKRYPKVVEQLEKVKLPDEADVETFVKVSDDVKSAMDYLLNYKVSDDLFAKCNPFTLTSNGKFYVENVVEGIASIIEQVTGKRIEAKQKKIAEATKGYQ